MILFLDFIKKKLKVGTSVSHTSEKVYTNFGFSKLFLT